MQLIAINTTGLTGAEILCAELARHPEIRILPGQNFIRYRSTVYRPHDYAGMDASDVFEMLSIHHYTRSGNCWAGLTKSMSPEMVESYDREEHKREFIDAVGSARQFPRLVEWYLKTYYSVQGEDISTVPYGGWFGNNIVHNAVAYPGLMNDAVFIDFSNPIDYWLANVNQRFVWDNRQTLKFWTVNQLCLRLFQRRVPHFLSVDVREYTNDRHGVARKLRRFLNLPPDVKLQDHAPDGFIQFSPDLVEKIERDAASLVPIYRDHALYKLATGIDEWTEDFLKDAERISLLERYRDFWNSSSHTNLDWVGPIEEQIVEEALRLTRYETSYNVNCWLYHDCFELTCDHYSEPTGKLEHYLGGLEEGILLPALPYYARVLVCYLENLADNCRRRPYSQIPVRCTRLYRMLTDPEYAKNFSWWAMTEKIEHME